MKNASQRLILNVIIIRSNLHNRTLKTEFIQNWGYFYQIVESEEILKIKTSKLRNAI